MKPQRPTKSRYSTAFLKRTPGRSIQLTLFLLLAFFVLLPAAWAHESRPAYLEIKETAPQQYDILWRTPVLSGMRLPVVLKLPDDVTNIKEPVVLELSDSIVERRSISTGTGSLAGKRIEFQGLIGTITDVLVRVQRLDGAYSAILVHPSQPWIEITPARGKWAVAGTYLVLGIDRSFLAKSRTTSSKSFLAFVIGMNL